MQKLPQSALAGITQSASVRLQSLTAEAFAPYGQVLQLDAAGQRAINQGTSSRLDLLADLDLHGANGQAVLAVFHAKAQSPRTPCQMLERHNWGSKALCLCWVRAAGFGWRQAPQPPT